MRVHAAQSINELCEALRVLRRVVLLVFHRGKMFVKFEERENEPLFGLPFLVLQ